MGQLTESTVNEVAADGRTSSLCRSWCVTVRGISWRCPSVGLGMAAVPGHQDAPGWEEPQCEGRSHPGRRGWERPPRWGGHRRPRRRRPLGGGHRAGQPGRPAAVPAPSGRGRLPHRCRRAGGPGRRAGPDRAAAEAGHGGARRRRGWLAVRADSRVASARGCLSSILACTVGHRSKAAAAPVQPTRMAPSCSYCR